MLWRRASYQVFPSHSPVARATRSPHAASRCFGRTGAQLNLRSVAEADCCGLRSRQAQRFYYCDDLRTLCTTTRKPQSRNNDEGDEFAGMAAEFAAKFAANW